MRSLLLSDPLDDLYAVLLLGRVHVPIHTLRITGATNVHPHIRIPTLDVPLDGPELGMGIHGEPGVAVGPLLTADEIAGQMLDRILPDLPFSSGDTAAVLVNSLGATAPEELYILYNKASQILNDRGINIHRAFIGEYATSMEMSGASISICKLDDEMISLLDAPAHSPLLLQQFGR